jgi:lipopolysaccharide biosynthesis protein
LNISSLQRNREAAATELGYVFTFLLGVLLLTMFSLWIYDIETATRERWNEEAIEANMNELSAAIERTDIASRIDNSSYAERVYWRATEADESQFSLELTDTKLILHDEQGEFDTERSLSGTASAPHTGIVDLAGVEAIWVVYHNGVISIELDRPMF